MKKTLLFLTFLLGIALQSWAYSFYAYAPSGQRLYYNNIGDGKVQVTYQNSSSPRYSNLSGALTIPESVTYNGTTYSVTSIGDNAFSGCTGLTSVSIPNSVTSIGGGAFSLCSGLTGTLTIPNSVTYIGRSAFYSCRGLTDTLTIPNSVTSIDTAAFLSCSGLTFVTIPNSVTSIGRDAFRNCSGLTGALAIPNSVTSIGESAFNNCSGLTSVTIPSSVTSIGDDTFYECTSLNSVTIPNSVISIGSEAFYRCSSLSSVTIPNSVTSIGGAAFRYCSGLTSVTIGNSVTSIGSGAFYYCTGLTSIIYTGNVEGWCGISFIDPHSNPLSYGHALYINDSLVSNLVIPNTVTSIGNVAFQGCSGLTSVTIPGSITSIGDWAFFSCRNLTEIHSLNNVAPTLGTNSFGNVTSSIPVYIPCGSLQSYQTEWSYFSNFIEVSGMDFNAVSDNETMGTAHIDSYPGCTDSLVTVSANANDGYLFDHWSDGSTDNPHTISVTSGMTITAYFVPAATVTVTSDNSTMGAGIGSGTYAIGGTATISANANTGYHFTQWQDGNTNNPRTIDVTADTSFTAYFEPNPYTVNVVSDNTEMGSATGGGTFDYGTTITISAEAVADYHFTQWNDGNTQNPRTVTVTADITYTAYFAIDEYTLTVVPNNTTYGTVAGGGTYAVGTTVTISAEANYGYHFTQWQDGNTDNPRTVTVTGNATYTANFEANNYVVTVLSDNPMMGTVTGGGTYAYGSTISISAQPAEGCWFAYWQDGNNDNPRYITVTGNAEYVAHFYSPDGIDDVTPADGMKVYTRGNTIVIDFSGQQTADSRQSVIVYDVMGRVIKQATGNGQQAAVEIPVTSAGVYMVKVGERPSRKVVVRP